jgi:hypothetical protein
MVARTFLSQCCTAVDAAVDKCLTLFSAPRRIKLWAAMLYAYLLLCIGGYASYLGAPPISILIIATLLALPNVVKPRGQGVIAIEVVAHSVAALIFASAAFAIGRGTASAFGV